jgi:hypothetical protein
MYFGIMNQEQCIQIEFLAPNSFSFEAFQQDHLQDANIWSQRIETFVLEWNKRLMRVTFLISETIPWKKQ